MTNLIDRAFTEKKGIKIMTHVVAGYPDLATNKELIRRMAEKGVDLIEIQVPFSDPLADGPTIMEANQQALDSGITPEHCFQLVKELKKEVSIPLLFMTYGNIAFNMGMERFVERSAEAGVSGLIIPDLPFDERIDDYIAITRRFGLYAVQVVSPNAGEQRLKALLKEARGFVYATLKVGITGAGRELSRGSLDFIAALRRFTKLPIAAGFGISSPQQVMELSDRVDAAVLGSHIIDLLDREGIDKAVDFIAQCKKN